MITAITEFAFLILLSVLGVPIGFAMGGVGIVAAIIHYGGFPGAYLAGITAWNNVNSWSLTMVPLFIFMGLIIGECGLGRDAYDCCYKWLWRLRGSLAVVATVSSALFGTITGSSNATIATIGGISLPEMKRLGYSVELRTGAVASAGILSNLIPPSLAAIFFGVLTEVSIGKLFIAGIIPGIILTIFYCITIWILVKRNPSIAPSAIEHFTLTQKVASLKGLLPILFIFALVIGGIYSGTFSPAEAAGIGAFLSLAVVFAMRRLTWKRFLSSLKGTMKITAFIMMIITGALLFAHTIAVTEFPYVLNNWIIGLQAPPVVILFVIILVTTLLGCVLDFFGTMVLTVPFLFPLVTQGLGYDPVWYGNFTVILLEIALLTPPVAANIYVTQGVDGEASSMDVIRGVMPFYIAAFTLLLLLVFFPQISMWLPSMM